MREHFAPHDYLAAAYALNGDTERAAAALAEAGRLVNYDRYCGRVRLRAVGIFGMQFVIAADVAG